MKEPRPISIDEAMARIGSYDMVIDTRSPAEHAEDHLPGAVSLPVLNNEERARVGTTHARDGAFEAKRQGAALVARNIGAILAGPLADKPAAWRPLVYCWRGGNRSASLATVLARVGWHVDLLEGGYRTYRRWVIDCIDHLAPQLGFRVLCGRTGTGKSRILQQLAARGEQVLDLEQLASHRGSVLGRLPGTPQPSQKQFESLLAAQLGAMDPSRPVYVESESRKIGQVQLPESLIGTMRGSACMVIDLPVALRTRYLISDYPHFLDEPAALMDKLERLRARHGHVRIDAWRNLAQTGQWESLVHALLTEHYDPAYDRSMARNYAGLDHATVLSAPADTADHDRLFADFAARLSGSTDAAAASPAPGTQPRPD